jgi:hypothetical protein
MKFFTPRTVTTGNALNTLAQEDMYRALENTSAEIGEPSVKTIGRRTNVR